MLISAERLEVVWLCDVLASILSVPVGMSQLRPRDLQTVILNQSRLTEGRSLPCARCQHLGGKIRLLLDQLKGELGALGYFEGNDLLKLKKLALLEVGDNLGVVGLLLLDHLELIPGNIADRVDLSNSKLGALALSKV